MHGSDHPVMNKIHITTNGVRKLLDGIKTHKATGPDNTPAHLLHILSHQLDPFLTRLFQFTIDSGTVPTDWKTANIIPIFKKGNRHKPSNYRPVSLTSICCKLLEHILYSNIMQHLETTILSLINNMDLDTDAHMKAN